MSKAFSESSFVQDFYPIIYNRGQLSFTSVPFPKCMLPVGQKLIFIQVSHIWAYCMFKQLTWHACQGHGAIITSNSPIPFLKEVTVFARSHSLGISPVSRDCRNKYANTGLSSFASSFGTLGWNSSGPKAFVGFKPLSNLYNHSFWRHHNAIHERGQSSG